MGIYRMKENLHRFVLLHPPWVIFMLSLVLIALGMFSLGVTLQRKASAKELNLAKVGLCLDDGSASTDQAALQRVGSSNMSIPISVHIPRTVISRFSSEHTVLHGMMYDGQIGLHGRREPTNWTFLLPVSKNRICTDVSCSNITVATCIILFGDDIRLPHIKELEPCQSNDSELVLRTGRLVSAMNSLHLPVASSICPESSLISLEYERLTQYTVISMANDTNAARLHLLCTSSFLFAMVVLMICVALWRKSSRLPKEILRDPNHRHGLKAMINLQK